MILYLASDLLWATRIKRTAQDLALPCRPAKDLATLAQRLDEGGVYALIVDLETEQRGLEMVRAAKAHPKAAELRVICFGPHVRTDLLDEAVRAGADQALARGAFDRRLAEILTALDAGVNPPQA